MPSLRIFFQPTGPYAMKCLRTVFIASPVAQDLTLPGAVTIDRLGTLWLLENNVGTPTVRKLERVGAHHDDDDQVEID